MLSALWQPSVSSASLSASKHARVAGTVLAVLQCSSTERAQAPGMRRSPVAEAAATAAMATRPSRRSVDVFMVSKRRMVVWLACNTNQTLVVMVGANAIPC
mmetsp:Transcript_11505/g.20360  ORF Transcript_11505/g.20360 Transcript_11505/m.20360 type:complete len:101 (+) Transcript_11505:423-725(+)